MKKRILSLLCIIVMLLPMLLSCDNLNESESTTPKQEEETTTAPEDLSDIPVRDVSDYPNDSFYLSEEEKAYLESQGVNPDQFLCKVFGGWNWLDYADMFEQDENEDLMTFYVKPFNVKNVLEFQYEQDTFYIYNKLSDKGGYLTEEILPTNFVVSQSNDGALFRNSYYYGAPQSQEFSSSDWLLTAYLLDVDGNQIQEPFTEEDRSAVFSAAQCTRDLKGLKIEKMYIMRPSSGMDISYEGTFTKTFYDMFIYYVTNYGDYILFTDRLYSFLMPLERFEEYLMHMRAYVHDNGNDLEPILDNEYSDLNSIEMIQFPLPNEHRTGYRKREFSPNQIIPSYSLVPYIIFGWRKPTTEAIDKLVQGIYP